MAPAFAEIVGLPHRRAEPFIAAAGIDRACLVIGDDVVDRPGVAERAFQAPGPPLGAALEEESALFRSHKHQHILRHFGLL